MIVSLNFDPDFFLDCHEKSPPYCSWRAFPIPSHPSGCFLQLFEKTGWTYVYPGQVMRKVGAQQGFLLSGNSFLSASPHYSHILSPGLKSDILHGKTGIFCRNLPLQRISVAVTLHYNTTASLLLQVFLKFFFVILVEFYFGFLYIMLQHFNRMTSTPAEISFFSSAPLRHYDQGMLPKQSGSLRGHSHEASVCKGRHRRGKASVRRYRYGAVDVGAA